MCFVTPATEPSWGGGDPSDNGKGSHELHLDKEQVTEMNLSIYSLKHDEDKVDTYSLF